MRFTDFLLIATLMTGLVWMLDRLFWRPRRLINVFSSSPKEKSEPLIVEYCRAFFPVLLLVFLLRSFLAEPFYIPSGSMRPTLVEGDFILVNKFAYGLRLPLIGTKVVSIGNPSRGDVVVFKHDKQGDSLDFIKRVVGLPGDHIEYKDKIIYVNGEAMKQEFVAETQDRDIGKNTGWSVRHQHETLGNIRHDIYVHTDMEPSMQQFTDMTVPNDSYFVMGDNRDNSNDSRSWGVVKGEELLGRALGVWFSWDSSKTGMDRIKHAVRWERIGSGLGITSP
jgi:signal peptidase I